MIIQTFFHCLFINSVNRQAIKSAYRDAIKRITHILFERYKARVVDILLAANFDFKGFENQFQVNKFNFQPGYT